MHSGQPLTLTHVPHMAPSDPVPQRYPNLLSQRAKLITKHMCTLHINTVMGWHRQAKTCLRLSTIFVSVSPPVPSTFAISCRLTGNISSSCKNILSMAEFKKTLKWTKYLPIFKIKLKCI